MISVKNLTFSYSNGEVQVLRRVNVDVATGEIILLSGPTGSGKSTFLKTLNGLAPHFTGGATQGSILIDDFEASGKRPHELAHLIGYVNQQPETAFATDTVEEELAFGMEQLGFTSEFMRQRVNWVSESLGIRSLLKQPLDSLSGGQQQRVAIGAAIAGGQKTLLLDEPTSALDDAGFKDVLALLHDLSRNHAVTVIMSEHRVARLMPHVDRILHLRGDGLVVDTKPQEFSELLEGESGASPVTVAAHSGLNSQPKEPLMSARGLTQSYAGNEVLAPIDVDLESGTITAITGENGSGKTSLLWRLLHEAWAQSLDAAMVPQNSADLLFLSSVSAELAEENKLKQDGQRQASGHLENLVGRLNPLIHPRDLSSGQQLALVLAIQLNRDSKLVLLDEPTRGLDAIARLALTKTLSELRNEGRAIVLATHDLDFAAMVADRRIHLHQGRQQSED